MTAQSRTRTVVFVAARIAFAVLFISTAFAKANNPDEFSLLLVRVLGYLGITVPAPIPSLAASAIILLESTLAGLFVAGIRLKAACVVSLLLLAAFTIFISIMLVKGGIRSCGCGGVLSLMPWGESLYIAVIRNILLIWALFWMSRNVPEAAHGQTSQGR